MSIYIGNLSYEITEDEVRDIFSAHGEVSSVSIIKDKYSGQSKGFGFVEMPNQAEAEEAIKALNESDLKGRNIKVNQARPKEERPQRRARYLYPIRRRHSVVGIRHYVRPGINFLITNANCFRPYPQYLSRLCLVCWWCRTAHKGRQSIVRSTSAEAWNVLDLDCHCCRIVFWRFKRKSIKKK